jgi:PAS domain S-box-containing protein
MSEKRHLVDSGRPQSLQQMGPILETLDDGVVVADESGQILFVNSVFEAMTGILRGEIIGRDAQHLYDRAENFALAQAFHRKSLEMGRSREEFVLPTRGGGRLPVLVSVRAMQGLEGGRFAIVTLTDISDQKRTEENLQAQTRGSKTIGDRSSKILCWRPEYGRAWHQNPSSGEACESTPSTNQRAESAATSAW